MRWVHVLAHQLLYVMDKLVRRNKTTPTTIFLSTLGSDLSDVLLFLTPHRTKLDG
jgi:hypothetical protein